ADRRLPGLRPARRAVSVRGRGAVEFRGATPRARSGAYHKASRGLPFPVSPLAEVPSHDHAGLRRTAVEPARGPGVVRRGAAPMLKRPRFAPHFHVEVLPGEGVLLLSDARHVLLRGRLYELVAPWLDGRPADDVCARLHADAPPAEVYYAPNQLERKGCL